MNTTPKPRKAAATAPVRLFYDYWLTADNRIKAGTVIDLPTAEAKRLIALDKAERADPMPGDE